MGLALAGASREAAGNSRENSTVPSQRLRTAVVAPKSRSFRGPRAARLARRPIDDRRGYERCNLSRVRAEIVIATNVNRGDDARIICHNPASRFPPALCREPLPRRILSEVFARIAARRRSMTGSWKEYAEKSCIHPYVANSLDDGEAKRSVHLLRFRHSPKRL